MQEADRKLAWSAVFVLAVIAAELSWFLFVGPAHHSADAAAQQTDQDNLPWWDSAAAWTAIFTCILTASTIGLWGQTKRLAEGAADQSKQMAKSLALAQREYDATHRPRIKLRNIGYPPIRRNVPVTFRITIANAGDNDATIVAVAIGVNRNTETGIFAVPLSPPHDEKKITLKGGQLHTFYRDAVENSESTVWSGVLADMDTLTVFGEITYSDKNNIVRRTGFGRTWDKNLRAFRRSQTYADFEYED